MADDWATRSAGAQRAVRLDQAGDVATYRWSSGSSQCSYDATLQAFKIAVDNSISESSASAVIKFAGSYGNNSTHWVSFRVRVDPVMAYHDFAGTGRPRYKLAILSRADNDGASNTLGSNPANGETVLQMTWGNNLPTAYYYDPSVHLVDEAFTSVNSSTSLMQPSVRFGANPLTGNDPSTGSAWTSAQQERARYGGVQDAESFDSEFVYGLGDAITGGFRLVPDTWITITVRIDIGTFGSANSRFRGWAALDGQPYRQLWDKRNITLGDGSAPNHTGIWLTPYLTGGASGGRRITAHDSNITGVTYHVCGPSTPSGVGQLSYTASTGRFQWRGSGGTYGTAVGCSSSIGSGRSKLTIAVKDNAGGIEGSYVVITVNTAALPGTDQVDNVTIATDGRPTGNIWYKDFIESTSPILAPGGFYPYPAWLENKDEDEWIQLPAGTAMDTVDPSPAPNPEGPEGPIAKINSWCGFAQDRDVSKFYGVANGGHTAYSGNEVDVLDLESDSPAWEQLRAPYLTPPGTGTQVYYAANEPSARHSYYGAFYRQADNKVYRFGGSVWNNGDATNNVFSYDVAANTYSAQNDETNMSAIAQGDTANLNNLSMVQDPSNDDIYIFGGTGNGTCRAKWTASTKAFSTLSGHGSSPVLYYAGIALDTTRSRILLAGGGGVDGGDAHHVWDIAGGTLTAITFTGSQAGIITNNTTGLALVYVPALDLFLMRRADDSGSTLHSIHPTTWAVEPYTTTGGGSVPQADNQRPLYSKFAYVPNLGGVLLCGTYATPAWFLKLHSLDVAEDAGGGAQGVGGAMVLPPRGAMKIWSYA